MIVDVISVGNSKGIRLPQSLLKECGIQEKVDLTVKKGCLVLQRLKNPREGWEAQFRKAPHSENDTGLEEFRNFSNDFDENEWEW